MKDLTSVETLAIPAGVSVAVKARKITVEGPRGTLVKNVGHIAMDIQVVSRGSGRARARRERWEGVCERGGVRGRRCAERESERAMGEARETSRGRRRVGRKDCARGLQWQRRQHARKAAAGLERNPAPFSSSALPSPMRAARMSDEPKPMDKLCEPD